MKHLSKKSTTNEARVYSKYKSGVQTATAKLATDLNSNGAVYNDYSSEFQEYCDYIYDLLKNDGILISSSIDTNDSTYNKYVDGKISINAFIKYAIKKNWISLDNLDVQDEYLSTSETYDLIVNHIIKDVKKIHLLVSLLLSI